MTDIIKYKMSRDLTTGNETKQIVIFAFPMVLGSVFQQLYNMADSVIVGKFVGDEALAATGTAFPVMMLMIAVVIGLGMGASIMVSQLYGAGDMANLRRTVTTSLTFFCIFSIIITVIGLFSASWLLKLLQTPAEIFDMSYTYLTIIYAGMPRLTIRLKRLRSKAHCLIS